jgi:hypothetical protein
VMRVYNCTSVTHHIRHTSCLDSIRIWSIWFSVFP